MELNSYYQDRGIVKYKGFFLSEHTTALNKDFEDALKINEGKEQMTPKEITDILQFSILKDLPVAIQLNFTLGDGLGFPDDIIGKLRGHDDTKLLIGEEYVYISSIRNVEIVSLDKWYKKATYFN